MRRDNKSYTRRDFVKKTLLGAAAGCGLLNCVTAKAEEIGGKSADSVRFKFAHVTDTHVSTTGHNGALLKKESINILADLVAQINSVKDLDFVLFGGDNYDNTDLGTPDMDKFVELADRLEMPYYIQFGNREAAPMPPGDPTSKGDFVKVFQKHGFNDESLWWSVSPKDGVRVIGIDTSIAGRNNGTIPQDEINWLQNELSSHADDLVMILTHHLILPTWQPKSIPKWKKSYVIANSRRVSKMLQGAKSAKLVLSGHHHVTHIQSRESLHYIASPAAVQYPHAFRIITVGGNTAELEFFQIQDKKIIALGKDLLVKHKGREYASDAPEQIAQYCLGQDTDRETKLVLR